MPIIPLPDFSLKVNDTGPNVAIVCSFSDGSVQSLVGAAGTFAMWKDGNPTTLKINDAAASIVNTGSSGGILYAWQAADTNAAGDYMAEFHVTTAGGKKVTFPNNGYIRIQISPRVS